MGFFYVPVEERERNLVCLFHDCSGRKHKVSTRDRLKSDALEYTRSFMSIVSKLPHYTPDRQLLPRQRLALKYICFFTLIVVSCHYRLPAQELTPEAKLRFSLLADSGLLPIGDSLSSPKKQRLLPERISFMEKGMWGENGILRSVGLASPLTSESRKWELGLRRTMLIIHQVGGFVTLALMGTAAYYGQRVIDGRRELRKNHFTFVYATLGSYSATAALSVLSPPPSIRRDEISTTTIHKTLAWVHFAGMVITPILAKGRLTPEREHIHQVSAYITTAVFATSLIVITL